MSRDYRTFILSDASGEDTATVFANKVVPVKRGQANAIFFHDGTIIAASWHGFREVNERGEPVLTAEASA